MDDGEVIFIGYRYLIDHIIDVAHYRSLSSLVNLFKIFFSWENTFFSRMIRRFLFFLLLCFKNHFQGCMSIKVSMLCQSDMHTSVRVFDESKTNINSSRFRFTMIEIRREIRCVDMSSMFMKNSYENICLCWCSVTRNECKKKENNLSSIWPRTSRIICPSVLEMNVKHIDKVDFSDKKDRKKILKNKMIFAVVVVVVGGFFFCVNSSD